MSRHGRAVPLPRPRSPPHSGIGIAAFVVALIGMLLSLFAAPFGLALQILLHLPGVQMKGDEVFYGTFGVLAAMDLIAAGMALVALQRSECSRVFPLIALVMCGLALIAIGIVVGFALWVQQA